MLISCEVVHMSHQLRQLETSAPLRKPTESFVEVVQHIRGEAAEEGRGHAIYSPGFSIFLHFRIYRMQHTAYGLVRVLAAGRRERAENKIPRSRNWEQLRMSEGDDVRRALRMRNAPRRRVVVGRHVAAQKLLQ